MQRSGGQVGESTKSVKYPRGGRRENCTHRRGNYNSGNVFPERGVNSCTHPEQALVHGEIAPVAVQKFLKHRRRVVLARLEQQRAEPQHPLCRRLSPCLVLIPSNHGRNKTHTAEAHKIRKEGRQRGYVSVKDQTNRSMRRLISNRP